VIYVAEINYWPVVPHPTQYTRFSRTFAHPGSYLSPRDLRSDAAPSRTDRDVAAGCPRTGATLIATSEELQPEEGVVMRPPFRWEIWGIWRGIKRGVRCFFCEGFVECTVSSTLLLGRWTDFVEDCLYLRCFTECDEGDDRWVMKRRMMRCCCVDLVVTGG
jgi:hypothetical protein